MIWSSSVVFGLLEVSILVVGIYLAVRNLKKFSHSRAIDFVVEAESKIDPLRHSLCQLEPAVIREIYKSYGVDELTDLEVKSFPFVQSVVSHVSRLYYLMSDDGLDMGLTKAQRDQQIDSWIKYLSSFSESNAMKVMLTSAIEKGDFNLAFTNRIKVHFDL